MNQNNQNSNWKKLLGFRNMQEKLENTYYYATDLIFSITMVMSVRFFLRNDQISNINMWSLF